MQLSYILGGFANAQRLRRHSFLGMKLCGRLLLKAIQSVPKDSPIADLGSQEMLKWIETQGTKIIT